MMNMKTACWLVLGSLLLTTNAAEKTMTLLPTGGAWAVTNGTWVAGIGGLEDGDVLVFDMSRLTAGSGYTVNLGDVTTPRLAGMKFINNNVGLNMQNIAFNFQDGADIYISLARVVIAASSINAGNTTPVRITRSGTGYMQLESTAHGARTDRDGHARDRVAGQSRRGVPQDALYVYDHRRGLGGGARGGHVRPVGDVAEGPQGSSHGRYDIV